MLLKQENPEMDDFERKKALNSLDFLVFNGYPCKM